MDIREGMYAATCKAFVVHTKDGEPMIVPARTVVYVKQYNHILDMFFCDYIDEGRRATCDFPESDLLPMSASDISDDVKKALEGR